MRLLLDTHAVIWALGPSRTLPLHARVLISDHRNTIFVSAISVMEIAAKSVATLGRAPDISAEEAVILSERAGYRLLSVTVQHAAVAETIAPFHGDPFDRLLLAQAQLEGLTLVTHDQALADYDPRTVLF